MYTIHAENHPNVRLKPQKYVRKLIYTFYKTYER